MIIKKHNFPNIGHIRAKQLRGKREPRWQLSIYPPTPGPLQGHEPAHMVEVEVDPEELERVHRRAPHLLGSHNKARQQLVLRQLNAAGGLKSLQPRRIENPRPSKFLRGRTGLQEE
jgi:hypothetical protein